MASYVIFNDILIASVAVVLILKDLIVRTKREACSSNLKFEKS
jgi:hypothetical protein